MGLKHNYTSTKDDPVDTTLIGKTKWNDNHYFTGGNLGALLYQGTDGLVTNLDSVAAGRLLVSAGAGSIPVWRTELQVTASAVTSTVPILAQDGSLTNAAWSFANDIDTGAYLNGTGIMDFTAGGVGQLRVQSNIIAIPSTSSINWVNGILGNAADLTLARDAANTLAQRNGATAQAFRPYGYSSGARAGYGAVQTALASLSLSGATTTASNLIPIGAFVIGIATTTTTTITGASGYQIGDGSDADRWGDITGTAVGTTSTNASATANPTGWFSAANNVVLTAKTSNFTGGIVQVVVFYLSTGAA